MKDHGFSSVLARKKLSGFVGWLPVLLCLVMTTMSLSAAERTWDGGGGDAQWSHVTN